MRTRRDAFRLVISGSGVWIVRGQRIQKAAGGALAYGQREPLPEAVQLQAGPASAIFDVETTALRYVRLGGREAVRAVYAAVRDSDWGTVEPKVSNLKVSAREGGFELSFDAACVRPPYDFVWRGRITGEASGAIRFTFDGEARSTFLRNRLGFVALHPVRECAGQPCEVLHADGTRESGAFPNWISPHQPFFNIRAIRHGVLPGVTADVAFEGEVFEMEDHRNWTDASYKTYCTPLALPFPVEVPAGTRVSQAVAIRFEGQPPAAEAQTKPDAVTVTINSSQRRAMPRLGLGAASHGQKLSAREVRLLKALAPQHLRVDCRLGSKDWREVLGKGVAEAAALGVPLELAVHAPEAGEAEARALSNEARKLKLAGVLLYRTPGNAADDAWLAPWRPLFAGTPLAVGTDDGFVQLNRFRPKGGTFDAVCYSINPQVHAIDNRTLVENVDAQAATVESARQFAPGKAVWISPVTLKPRYNPNARGPAAPTPKGELPANVDARQMSLFGAAWTIGSLAQLSQAGAARVTYYETTGWRGVMETAQGSPVPDRFPSTPGMAYPLSYVFADVAGFSESLGCAVSEPLCMAALALRSGGRTRLLLANYTGEKCGFRIEGISTKAARIRRMNGEQGLARRGERGPLPEALAAYEVITVDLASEAGRE